MGTIVHNALLASWVRMSLIRFIEGLERSKPSLRLLGDPPRLPRGPFDMNVPIVRSVDYATNIVKVTHEIRSFVHRIA